MPLTSPNLQIAIDSSNTTGWTFNGSNIANISSLEGASGFLDQGDISQQPLYENGLIKNTVGNPQFMWTPNPGSDDSIWWPESGQFIVSLRFRIDSFPSGTYNFRKLLTSRDDSEGAVSIYIQDDGSGPFLRTAFSNTTISQVNISLGTWYTVTYQFDGANATRVAKSIINTGTIDSGSDTFAAVSSFSRVFGDPNQTDFAVSYSHFYLSHEYLTDIGLQEVHDFVANEFNSPSSGIIINPITTDGTTVVPEGTVVEHNYCDDNQGTNETHIETLYTDSNGQVTLQSDIPAGKVRMTRVIYQSNGNDISTETFYTD